MPRNGTTGLYVLVHDWEDDDANDIPIQSDRFMEQEQDIADALTASIAKDGQTTPTANLPMGGFKHTGVAVASSLTDYLRADQIQKNDLNAFTATGTDTYAITPAPAVAALATYMSFRILFTNGNTGACTLTVGATAQKALTKRGAIALIAGDIPAGSIGECMYDGTQYQLLNVAVEPDYFTAGGTDTYTVTASPAVTAYVAGRAYKIKFTNGNTGAATINFNGVGARAITKNGTTALGSGDIPAGAVVTLVDDGTRFQATLAGASVTLGLTAGAAQTAGFTAAINTRYVCNFTANATVTLPASATAGDVIVLALGSAFNVTLDPNGLKINASTALVTLPAPLQTVMITYTGATNGWV